MKNILVLQAFLIFLTLSSCTYEQPWTNLFNGIDLETWDKFIGTPLSGFDSLAEAATVEKVFSVIEDNGEKIIRISGEVNGALATMESFRNYHLHLEFKWGDEVYTRRNSGLLYHSFGDFGAAFGTWMANIEHQLLHENLGDTYLMVNTTCETMVSKSEDGKQFIFNPGGEKLKFGEKDNGRSIKKMKNAEKPLGEWNSVDLYCFENISVHVVNGETVMVNSNTGTYAENGIQPLTSGKIQLQSEGGELFFKNIKIQSIKKLPKEILP